MEADEDSRLMIQVARGNRGAFATLFDRYQVSMVRFCARFVGDVSQGEELAQDIFVKLYQSASSYQPTAQFKTFLFRVATNHCLNQLRKPRRNSERSEEQDKDESGVTEDIISEETPQGTLEAKEVEAAVERALNKMSERERAAFTMCRFEGMAYQDIAFAMEASEGAVKSLIHRATLQVMKQLEDLNAASNAPPRGLAHG